MTIALGKSSFVVMKCQHETLQWGPLEHIQAIAIHTEQSAAQWARAKLAKSVCAGGRRSSFLATEGDAAAMQYHDSGPSELPSWQRTCLYKLIICIEDKQLSILVFWNLTGSGRACVPGRQPPSLISVDTLD